MNTCRTCKFWKGWRESNYTPGWCRRHAPSLVERLDVRDHMSKWPPTESEDWCGDWELHHEVKNDNPA